MTHALASRLVRSVVAVLVLTASIVARTNCYAQNVEGPGQVYQTRAWHQPIKLYQNHPSRAALRWANIQLRRMTLDEKIGQLIFIGINGKFLNEDSDEYRALIHLVRDNHVGGVVLYHAPVYESVHLVSRLQKYARYPFLISADMEFGAGMRFDDTVSLPWNMAVAATGNTYYAQLQGEIIAHEANALGIRQVFGPVADVNNNAANPIINVRSYGEDPEEVAAFAAAFIRGLQANGVIATAKHFPGHGDATVDSHRGLPVIDIDRERLDRVELVPFRAAINAGVGSIMASFIALPKIDPTIIEPLGSARVTGPSSVVLGGEVLLENATLPAALSPAVIQGLLRQNLHFDGLIATDALDMSGLTMYFNQDEAAVRAVEAGADELIKPSDPDAAMRALREAVRRGRITEQRIEDSARRIMAAKYDLGLSGGRGTSLDTVDRQLSDRHAADFAKQVARRAITLVRNDAKLLPLDLSPGARVFNLAITNGDDRLIVSDPFVQALKRSGRRVSTAVLDDRSSEDDIRKAIAEARNSDLVIASLYGRVRAGESRSVGLPERSIRGLNELIKENVRLIGISFGNPYLLEAFPGLRTYVIAYGDMPSLQEAAANAILGKADISGRLPITIPSLYQRGAGIKLKAAPTK
jgi:beta-N-acetylhexosaminidase